MLPSLHLAGSSAWKWLQFPRAQQRIWNTALASSLPLGLSPTKVAPQSKSSKVPYVPTKAVAILGVEAGAVDEVDTAANHVSCGECGTIGLTSPRGAEGMPIISMVTVGMFIPTCGRREQSQLSRGT